jgi:hypothetical protein
MRPAPDERNIMNASVLRTALALPLLLPLGLVACGGGEKTVTPVADGSYGDNPNAPPSLLATPGKGNKQQEAGVVLGVNAYLWRGALDTLAFMPLASVDPFGGVIITDWYSPPSATDERFKATAYILGRTLRADGIRVTIFRQVRDGGQWTDAPVNPATASDIENKILAAARELRAAQAAGK